MWSFISTKLKIKFRYIDCIVNVSAAYTKTDESHNYIYSGFVSGNQDLIFFSIQISNKRVKMPINKTTTHVWKKHHLSY